jgi:hypothetical protein
MKRLNGRQAAETLRLLGSLPVAPQRALGSYGEGDPNTHNQSAYGDGVFNAAPGGAMGQSRTAGMVQAAAIINNTSFSTYPFAISQFEGAVSILPQNPRRTALLIQNQSATEDLYINFSGDAAVGYGMLLGPEQGILFDQVVPNNSVSIFFDAATVERGVVIEGAPVA